VTINFNISGTKPIDMTQIVIAVFANDTVNKYQEVFAQ